MQLVYHKPKVVTLDSIILIHISQFVMSITHKITKSELKKTGE